MFCIIALMSSSRQVSLSLADGIKEALRCTMHGLQGLHISIIRVASILTHVVEEQHYPSLGTSLDLCQERLS